MTDQAPDAAAAGGRANGGVGRAGSGRVAIAGLALSAVALLSAPLLMPEGYSWVSNTTSESAAQGIGGAWMARAGFVLFGAAVLVLCRRGTPRWGPVATWCHAVFGLCLVATAIFSTRSWVDGAAFDRTEDGLHSLAATVMGFAFAGGVVAAAVTAHRRSASRRSSSRRSASRRSVVDAVAVTASVAVPLAMVTWPDLDGALQRAMFAIAYLWYASEAWGRERV